MGSKRKRNCEFKEKQCAKALFGEEIGRLVDDDGGLERWSAELRIFSSVFQKTDDFLVSATSNEGNTCQSDPIFCNGCVPSQSGNTTMPVIEFSCLPEGLESQGASARHVKISSDISNHEVIGASLENEYGFLSSEFQKNLESGLHVSSMIAISSEDLFVIPSPRPAENVGDGYLQRVSLKVVDAANEHSDEKEAMQQHITWPVIEPSVDKPQEFGNNLVFATSFVDASSKKNFGMFSSTTQIADEETFTLGVPGANDVCGMGSGSKLTPQTGNSCLPMEVESHDAAPKQVNLQTIRMLSSKRNFVNNALCGYSSINTSSDNSSDALVTKPEENPVHDSMPQMLLDIIEDAPKVVDDGDTEHSIADLVAESSILDDDILYRDYSAEKPVPLYGISYTGQSVEKPQVALHATGLEIPIRNEVLAKETKNVKTVTTLPVSQESSVCRTSENNTLSAIDNDVQPLNIVEGNVETRTREALLLMSDEVKTSWKKAFTAELRTRLWQHIKDFLVAAGFEVQYRHRPKRGATDSIYISPGKDRVSYASAVKAWKASSELLFCGKKKSMLHASTREWKDATDFWAELTDVLAIVEMDDGKTSHEAAILKRWVLLDPFVTMLFVERLQSLRTKAVAQSVKDPHAGRISMQLVRQGKSKVPVASGDPFAFSLDSELQLESNTSHNQLADVLQVEGSKEMVGTPVSANIGGASAAKRSSSSRKYGSHSQQNCLVKEVEMSLKDSRCASAFSNLNGSHIGIASNALPERRNQINILDKEPHKEGNPLGVEHKNVRYLCCRRSPRKADLHNGSDDTIAHPTGVLSPKRKQNSKPEETMSAQPYEYPSCSSLQDSHFEAPRTMKRTCEQSKNPVTGDLHKSSNSSGEVEASMAQEHLMVIDMDGEAKSSKIMKKIHDSHVDRNHKEITKPAAAACLHHDVSRLKNKNLHEIRAFKKEAIVGVDGRKSLVRGLIDGASSVCEASTKAVKVYKWKNNNENGRKKLKNGTISSKKVCQINDDDLLIAAIIKNKDLGSNVSSIGKARKKTARTARKLKSYRGGCKLLPRSPGKGGQHIGKQPTFYKRTVLSWMIDSGALFENEIVRYQSKSGEVVKDGWITRDGLFCKCCNMLFSLSEFKIHAGSKVGRSLLNLFVETGDSFTLCQLQAWSAEYKARKAGKSMVDNSDIDLNDDTCGLCGDGGVLICCDSCPSTFHHACLGNQLLPESNWYCPYCTCDVCGDAVLQPESALDSSMPIHCVQCERKYHKPCLSDRVRCGGDGPTKQTWFCGENCQGIHSGLRSHLGVTHHIGEGLSWTLLKCIQSDQRVHSAQGFALMAECNTKLAVALSIMEECFVPMIDPRTGIDMIPHALYNWGSCFTRLNYQGFYTIVLEKGDEVISVASIRVHGVVVAELPLIATCSGYRRQGMCRRLMNAIEEMLRLLKVERLVILAIPELIDTWTKGFGFKQMDDSDKELFNNISLMIFPGTTLLEKHLQSPQSFQLNGTELAAKKVGEQLDEQNPSLVILVPEPGEQAAKSCQAAKGMVLESVHRNLGLEEMSLNGLMLASASEMDPSAMIVECRHQDDQIGNITKCVVVDSVQVNRPTPHSSVAFMPTSINSHPDAQRGECNRTNEPLDNSKGDNVFSRHIRMMSMNVSGISKPDLEGCNGNLQVRTEVMKHSTLMHNSVGEHNMQSSCSANYSQLRDIDESCQKMDNLTTRTSAGLDLIVHQDNGSFTGTVEHLDRSLGSQHPPPFCKSDASNGKITDVVYQTAAVDLLNLNANVLHKENLRSSPVKDHASHQSLFIEKGLVESPCSPKGMRFLHIKANSTENDDDVEECHNKEVNNGDHCVEKGLMGIPADNDSRLLSVTVSSSSTKNGADVEAVHGEENGVMQMTIMMNGDEERGETGNVSVSESSGSNPLVINPVSSVSKSPNLQDESAVIITLPKLPRGKSTAETGTFNAQCDAIHSFEFNGCKGIIAGQSSMATQSTTTKSSQKPNHYIHDSPPLMDNSYVRSVKDKMVRSESGSNNSPRVRISRFAKQKKSTPKEIVLGLACPTYGDVQPKSSVKVKGKKQRFHG